MKGSNMRRSLSLLLSVYLLAFAVSGFVAGQDPEMKERINKKLATVTSESTSGIAILVSRDGKILIEAAGGMADIERKIPITIDTQFRIGSVSKQFTAMAVLRLAEQGKLSLQDHLDQYYPELPNASSITLESLLTHTSGLACYTATPQFYARVTRAATSDDVLALFSKSEPDFKPHTEFKYCNSGYFLLGEIVAKVSGKSFSEYLDTEFFQPLGMNNTGIYFNSKPPKNAARGYRFESGTYQQSQDWDMSWIGGAGAMYSTVGDLHLWNEALHNGKVVSKESFAKATTPYKSSAGAETGNYGYGLMIAKHRGIPIISHGGGVFGWTAESAYYPAQRCSVIVLTNAMPAALELTPQPIARSIATRILEDAFKSVPTPQVDKTISSKTFPEYIGKYNYADVPAVMEITVEKEKIFATISGQEPMEIVPTGKDQFYWKDVDAEVSFARNEKGEITSALHSQNGMTIYAPRIAEGVALSESQLDAFVGRYQYGPAIMTCTREGTQLFAQISGQPKLPIFAVSENSFAWKVVQAKVEFVKDDDGKVTTARHTQGGQTFDAPRLKD
jgi:CubicO group peptidase (beta-lactamase class C family)